MIADLRVKGRDSAVKLRKALYSMFDLDILEAAINDLGRTDLKTTVIGKLYLSKGTIASGGQIAAIKSNIESAMAKLEKIDADLALAEKRKADLQEIARQVSEQIGGHKSKADYERQRRMLKGQRDLFLRNATDAQAAFGDAVLDMFPQLLIAKAVEDAKRKISLKIEKTKLPVGVSQKLITYLLSNSTTECICGRPLCTDERNHIREYINMLPPKSYSSLYNEFSQTARSLRKGYDPTQIEDYIVRVLDNNEKASECDHQIRELDDAEKKSPDIETLIVTRQEAEAEIASIEEEIKAKSTDRKKFDIYLKRQMQDFDKLTKESEAGTKVAAKIAIMERVATHFRQRLEHESLEYSRRLEENIQSLIDSMLTSRRKVAVSPEFAVRITDMFLNILLNEYAKAARKIYPDMPDPLLITESKELLTYLHRIAVGCVADLDEFQFNREYFKIHIFLTANSRTFAQSGLRPYLKHMSTSLSQGTETLYIFGLGRKMDIAKQITDALKETDFRITQVIPHFYRHRSIQDGHSVHGVCYEVCVYEEDSLQM